MLMSAAMAPLRLLPLEGCFSTEVVVIVALYSTNLVEPDARTRRRTGAQWTAPQSADCLRGYF